MNGHSNGKAEYVREEDFRFMEKISETTYDLPTIVYNKLEYLVGEKNMNEYVENPNTYFCEFLTNSLDGKYGDGAGVKMYSLINDLILCCPNHHYEYMKMDTRSKLEEKYKEANDKQENNTKLVQYLKSIPSELLDKDFANALKQAKQVNQSYKSTIEDIFECMEKNEKLGKQPDKAFSKARKQVYENLLKKFEKFTLNCIEKDVGKISCKNEALNYVESWDHYRNRCSIPKEIDEGLDYTDSSMDEDKNFKLTFDIQHELYKKCCKFKALNIKNEDIFNAVIESCLYDINNVRVKQEDNKVTISDKYVIDIRKSLEHGRNDS